ncbi:MAG: hypothetical protein AABX77_01065 [Nanoarchaeota archaeon]
MKKQSKELKKGDKIKIADKDFIISEIEISDIGKQGKRKVRLVCFDENNEKLVIIRPEDYVFDSQ